MIDIQESLRRSLARKNFNAFIRYTYPEYQMGWFHEELAAALDQFLSDVVNRKSPRLIVAAPPRHGKTEQVSVRLPAYALGNYPEMQIIGTAYSQELATENNQGIQRVIESEKYLELFPHIKMRWSNQKKFSLKPYNGAYRARGVGNPITGMGGDICIVDDPYKTRKEAESGVQRNNIYDWFTSTLSTRVAPGGGILIIATRWHGDDLTGRITRMMSEDENYPRWKVISYPALATKNEKHRKIGEALHPERFNAEALKAQKLLSGSRDFESLYQQNPFQSDGAVFKPEWFKYYFPQDIPTEFDETIISCDFTFKDSAGTDYVAMGVWGRKDARFFFLDLVRERMDFVESIRQFTSLTKKWPEAMTKLIEDKANGPAIISTLQDTITGIIPCEPYGSKIARANAVTPLYEAGNVYYPHPSWCVWSKDAVDEHVQFPSAPHDDIVDQGSQALKHLSESHAMNLDPGLFSGPSMLDRIMAGPRHGIMR